MGMTDEKSESQWTERQADEKNQTILQENSEYINILLKELEAVQQENASLRSKRSEKNPWKILAISLALCMVAGLLLFFRFYFKEYREAVNAGNFSKTPIATPTAVPLADKKENNSYVRKDLKEYVSQLTAEQKNGVRVTVEELFGYEYLCITVAGVKVCYRNEFEPDKLRCDRVLLDNGSAQLSFSWDYDLTAELQRLVPKSGYFAQNGSKELAFVKYAEGNSGYPEKLRFIDGGRLLDYGELSLSEALQDTVQVSYSEEVPGTDGLFAEGDTGKRMTIRVSGAEYTYCISDEEYVNAMLYGDTLLETERYFELQLSKDGARFRTVLTINGEGCLGELTGVIRPDGLRFVPSGIVFGAYVTADIEDVGSNGVSFPTKQPVTEYIFLSGKNGERFLIPLSDAIAKHSYDFRNWIKAEDTEESIGRYEYIKDGKVVSISGIDVSKYQGTIDWEKVKTSGVEYAILRLGYRGMNEGTLELDPYYLENVKKANAAGIKVGIYFFSQAKNEQEAVEEAAFVLKNIKGYKISYPVVFDTEEVKTYDARANGLSRKERTDVCIAFCEQIKKAGYTPMIYANKRYMVMGLELERLQDIDKWYADYDSYPVFPYEFTMLQYSDTARVPGIEGAVDLDVSFVDYAK